MNAESRVVTTVNLDYDQLLVIESSRGAPICVIHRGVVLVPAEPTPDAGRLHRPNGSLRRWADVACRLLRNLRERLLWTKTARWAPI